MPQSGVAEARGHRSLHEERKAALDAARAALLEWDAREQERLPSAVRALDDWAASERETVDRMDWSRASDSAARGASKRASERDSERDADIPASWTPPGGIPGRRTVTIRGQVADRYVPTRSQTSRRRPERRYERSGFRPDRAAMWAFVLGLMLILAAVTSAHAATLHAVAHLH
jgi:hypothetical protein